MQGAALARRQAEAFSVGPFETRGCARIASCLQIGTEGVHGKVVARTIARMPVLTGWSRFGHAQITSANSESIGAETSGSASEFVSR